MCPRAHTGIKLQQFDPATYKKLAPPLALFNFDWATAPLETLCEPRAAQFDLKVTRAPSCNHHVTVMEPPCNRHATAMQPSSNVRPNCTSR